MRPPHLLDASSEEAPISAGEFEVAAQGGRPTREDEKGKKQTKRGSGEVSPCGGNRVQRETCTMLIIVVVSLLVSLLLGLASPLGNQVI